MEIESCCSDCGRQSSEINILAATKYSSAGEINECIKSGIKIIGENKIQDAANKFSSIMPVRKHFIGHLQSNKVKQAVALFDMIESVDSIRLMEKINAEAGKTGKLMEILIQVNVAAETRKFGFEAQDVDFAINKAGKMMNIKLRGLMIIMPLINDADSLNKYFALAGDLFDQYRSLPDFNILSMGMTQDYKMALKNGSTEIRLGSLIFK